MIVRNVRGDSGYRGRAKSRSPGQDSNSPQDDAANYVLPATNFVSLRVALTFGSRQVAAFVDNLLGAHTVTNDNSALNPGTGADRLERA